jgi:hypothetical protein
MFKAAGLICCALLSVTASAFPADDAPAPTPGIVAVPEPKPLPTPKCDSYSMQTVPHLSFEQRVCYWDSQLFTPTALAGALFSAAYAQITDDPKEWPQDARGFGYRFGTRYTQGMVKSTATFLAGVVSREDPRPVPPGEYDCPLQSPTLGARIGRSVARVFVSYDLKPDKSCSIRPAPARVIGSFASGFLQLAWLPDPKNNPTTALKGSGSALGGYVANSVFSEFQGDLWRALGKVFTAGKSNRK